MKKVIVSDKEKLKIVIERNYTERFELLVKLIRIGRMLKSAKIIQPTK